MTDFWARRQERAEEAERRNKTGREDEEIKKAQRAKPKGKRGDPWAESKSRHLPNARQIPQAQEEKSLTEQFRNDEESLHGLSMDTRIEKKRRLVQKYREHCVAFAEEGGKKSDPIFEHWVIWLWDVGDFESFFRYVDIAIALDLRSPFKRSYREFKMWEVLQWAEEEHGEGRSPEPWFSRMFEEVRDWSGVQQHLAKRCLTLEFKLLADGGNTAEALRIGEIALRHKAKIKTKYGELLKAAPSDPPRMALPDCTTNV